MLANFEVVDDLMAEVLRQKTAAERLAIAEALSRSSQFNVIHIPSGLKVGVMLPAKTPYTEREHSRIKRIQDASGSSAWYAAPEDVILNKLHYFKLSGSSSQKHVRDIAGMLKISGEHTDQQYILEWAAELELLDAWQELSVLL